MNHFVDYNVLPLIFWQVKTRTELQDMHHMSQKPVAIRTLAAIRSKEASCCGEDDARLLQFAFEYFFVETVESCRQIRDRNSH